MIKLKKIWNDSVWSKVISACIVGLSIYVYNYFSEIKFLEITVKLYIVLILFFLLLICFFIYQKYIYNKNRNSFLYDEETLKIDKELFIKIKELLPPESITWLRNNDFGGHGFKEANLDPFDNIEFESENKELEFFNPYIESLKKELIDSILDFNSVSLSYIFNGGYNKLTIPPEWETEQPERFYEAVNEIHKRTELIGNSYDKFISETRKILKVK